MRYPFHPNQWKKILEPDSHELSSIMDGELLDDYAELWRIILEIDAQACRIDIQDPLKTQDAAAKILEMTRYYVNNL